MNDMLCPDPNCRAASAVARLQKWISDLQSGMYINCVYCGHRYGPKDGGATLKNSNETMQAALKRHVESCPEHPMTVLKKENAQLKTLLNQKTMKKDQQGT